MFVSSSLRKPLFTAVSLALCLSAAHVPVSAAEPPPQVAHVSLLENNVGIADQSNDAQPAILNAPVFEQNAVITGDASRAEITISARQYLRLASDTQARFSSLQYHHPIIQVGDGTVELSILGGDRAPFTEIDTPSVAVLPRSDGRYRVSVDDAGTSHITVRSGTVTIQTAYGSHELTAGQTELASGSGDQPQIEDVAYQSFDAFDGFVAARDHAIADAFAQDAIDAQFGGVAALASYGHWVVDPNYGNVWVPAEPVTWSPYREGRWIWEDGYGWTWLASEPWGWAPHHYGRWYHSPAIGWCWTPPAPEPAVVVAPWSPALVGFVSVGAGFSFGVGLGSGVAWVPLAPNEPSPPWWNPRFGHGPVVINNSTTINNTVNNTTIVNNYGPRYEYRNLRVPNAVVGVSGENFREGMGHAVSIPRSALSDARAAAPPVVHASPMLRRFSAARFTPSRPMVLQSRFAQPFTARSLQRRASILRENGTLPTLRHAETRVTRPFYEGRRPEPAHPAFHSAPLEHPVQRGVPLRSLPDRPAHVHAPRTVHEGSRQELTRHRSEFRRLPEYHAPAYHPAHAKRPEPRPVRPPHERRSEPPRP